MDKRDLNWGRLIKFTVNQNQGRTIRNKNKFKNTSPQPLLSSQVHLYSQHSYLLSLNGTVEPGMGLWSIIMFQLCLSFSFTPLPSLSLESFPWDTVCHKMLQHESFHRLQFFMNCSGVGPSHRVQSLRTLCSTVSAP